MSLRLLIIATVVLATVAFAQVDTPYQIRYASNLNIGDSVINISNSGARDADLQAGKTAAITGSICVNAYAFSPDEQMVSCCSCPVTPNGLASLSVKGDLVNNTLTPAVPTAVVIKLLATVPKNSTCDGSAQDATADLSKGMLAWGTTLHADPTGTFSVTETAFSPSTLSDHERNRLNQLCTFIKANGSGFGVCNSCKLGGLGGVHM